MDFTQLPKAELHCHLDGILDREMARAIRTEDPEFPVRPEDFDRLDEVRDWPSFLKWWAAVAPLSGRLDLYESVVTRHIDRLKADGVVYAEIMISGGEVAQDPVRAVDEIGPFRSLAEARAGEALRLGFLMAFGRGKSAEQMARIADRAMVLYDAGLIEGVALAGEEAGHPVAPHQGVFEALSEAGLGIEIHAGEQSGPESVWDALEYGRPDRLGHAVSAFQDERLVEAILERDIHVEMCPTSNLKTGCVQDIADHPVCRVNELGMSISINTDDPGAFGCTMVSEYRLLYEVFGFTQNDLDRIYSVSVAAEFNPAR